ncbi:hypothetical protein [Teichococcus coralli]|nr:hypothetical protein [Pseudoroseomonas coralli]
MRPGDVLELIGQRHTAVIAAPPYPKDEDLEIVRLDGLQRANAGMTTGERIAVKRAQARPATPVTVAPAQKNLRLTGSGEAMPTACRTRSSGSLPRRRAPGSLPPSPERTPHSRARSARIG